VLEKMHHAELDGRVPVSAVARPVEFALAPDMSLTTALEAFLREQATVLPVTAGQWRNTLLGEVARNDVMLAIQDRLTYPK
jgi:Mg/Co/Ni transporter MgtE